MRAQNIQVEQAHRAMRANNKAALFLTVALSGLATACGPDYPHCDHDSDCHEHEFCVDGQCQQCRTNTDCAAGQQCTNGRCDAIPGYCDNSHPCPGGEQCENNRCTAVTSSNQCDDAHPCPAGQHCESGQCVGETPQLCNLDSVYFAFDSDALDDRSRNQLQTDAQCIRERGVNGVHLTGHADERGTEEYNMALSERRAQAVLRYLQSLGLGSANGSASGMGEEQATGTDESAWQHDRRVDLHER